jgi:hypothetical protein
MISDQDLEGMLDEDVRYVLTDQGREALRAAERVESGAVCPRCYEPWTAHVGTWGAARLCWVELRWS